MEEDYYEILRVHPRVSDDEIKEAYRRLAHKHHPDMGGDAAEFRAIHEAYEFLSDPEQRKTYDSNLSETNEDSIDEGLIDAKLKQAIYKNQNGDIAGAETILEEVAFSNHASYAPYAWVYLGGMKLGQLDSGRSNVQQALNCFAKAAEINPAEKKNYQHAFCNLSMQQIERFLGHYSETKKAAAKASHRAFGSLALGGLSLLLGSQAKKKNNRFGAAAGAAGGVYGVSRSLANRQQSKNTQQLLTFYTATIKQLFAGIKSYCSDNETVYQYFLNRTHQLGLSGWVAN